VAVPDAPLLAVSGLGPVVGADPAWSTQEVGVYLHVPFCARRCDYCSFATWTDRSHLMARYLEAVGTELARAVDRGLPAAATVFVGGGTPSLVPATELASVLRAVPRAPDAEVTVECNPDDVTEELLDTYLEAGVTRISLGVQSMVPSVLTALGRTHGVDNVVGAVELIRSRPFASWNVDVIYGGAGETLEEWRRTVAAVVALEPPHVSAYALTVEAGTPLAADASRHPDDDDQADKYQIVTDAFAEAGLEWYEISNWARPGHRCRHNELYWRQDDYLGVGCAAHSHLGGRRWWNHRTPERYLECVRAGRSAEGGFEVLDATTRRIEGLQLALRTTEGVPVDALPAEDVATVLQGLVEPRHDRLVLTPAGRLLANDVAVRLR